MTAPLFGPDAFVWMLGIEDTCVYPVTEGVSPLDEHELTGHSQSWQEDLRTAAELGARALRYGVSWPVVHVAPGRFDWSALDKVVDYAEELGLELVADLVHYGTPPWLTKSFADPRYPDAIEEFAGALATRYAGRITHFTPLNEPVTTASFCGLRGVWPPALTGWEGWTAVVVPAVVGMARATAAIRSAQSSAQIVHVEAATDISTDDPELTDHATLLRHIGWLPTDLLLGRVDYTHPMWSWLLRHGAQLSQLEWLLSNPAIPDVIGVNYYPDLTPRRLHQLDGEIVQVAYNGGAAGLGRALKGFAERYERPLLLTETSIEGADAVRTEWLQSSVDAVRRLVADGLDLRGYTWWPMFDFVDWSWAAGGANVEEFAVATTSTDIAFAPPLGDPAAGKTAFLRRMGLLRLEERPDGTLARIPTPAAIDYARRAH
ncbi:family 1 glycosylhydrolase [Kribbella sp. NPDC055071]